MSTALAPVPSQFITAEEYLQLAPTDRPSELVRGKIVVLNPPFSAHGYWCVRMSYVLSAFVEEHGLGRVVSNDSGVITERSPDTVRGADVAFYSFNRVPKGPLPAGFWGTPELVCEVRSTEDRWKKIIKKVGEYLDTGVTEVWVVDRAHAVDSGVFRTVRGDPARGRYADVCGNSAGVCVAACEAL